MSNQINDLSPSIRDFLLNRNLIVSDTVSNNGLSNIAVGLGNQASIQNSSNSIQASEDIENSSIPFRNGLVSRNQYTSIEDMVQATIISNSFSYNQINGGYIENNGELNIGGPSTDALDVITSVTSQEGFGLGEGGFFPNNNVNTSITGRVLGGIGAINDTPLGIIGGQQLLLAFKQKAAANIQRELFGKVNLQPFSLLRGAQFLNPDYSITVSSSSGGRILDTALDLSGFELPISKLDAGASIFENNALFQPNSVTRNNSMIRNTGKGQILRLFEVLNQNTYKPNYISDRDDDRLGIVEPLDYGPSSGGTTVVDFVTGEPVEMIGDRIWSSRTLVVDDNDNTLLTKTKLLFQNKDKQLQVLGGKGEGYKSLYDSNFNLQGTPDLSKGSMLTTPSGFLQDKRLSKGSGVLSESYLFDGDTENMFCRTWDSIKSYDNRGALQKNTGLQDTPNRYRRNIEKSVLDSNGFVKISPYKVAQTGDADAKKFMFSIENLAWNDRQTDLPIFETGAGDPVTGTKGRIMWFPPYDIKFQENTNVNWDKTNFIGRGEPIYTYNNTERSGQLSFKIIIDHPDYLNDREIFNRANSNEIIASIAAGCTDYERFFSPSEYNEIRNEVDKTVPVGNATVANERPTPEDINFYFPNDVGTLSPVYEISGQTYGQIPSEEGFNSAEGTLYDNGKNVGLNDFWNNQTNIDVIKKALLENKGIITVLNSYASLAGTSVPNQRLSDARLASVKAWIVENLGSDVIITEAVSNGSGDSTNKGEPDVLEVKKDRKVTIDFTYDASKDPTVVSAAEIEKVKTSSDKELINRVKRRFVKESEYFDKLESSDSATDKIIYSTIKEKIKFFQPAFHSTTPEGFNSRLTFLQQCTRQGPTDSDTRSNNLAFGSPPICILRIGDFYNTKIVINSLSFVFEPLVWDLNPEGVGVQPMIANVDLNFNFIGGSSLTGPINKLQNAVSFNYFANTEVYDPRADVIVPTNREEPAFSAQTGTRNFRDILDENDFNSPTSKSGNQDLPYNQEVQAEVSNETVVGQSSTTTNSFQLNKILLISYDNLGYVFGDDTLTLDFEFKNDNTPIQFNGNVTGNLILRSNDPLSYNVHFAFGSLIARENDNNLNNFIIENKNGTDSIIIDSGITTFSITVDINDPKNFALFYNEINSQIKKGNITLEWVTTPIKLKQSINTI
tara:strand:+ start:4161 stop:7709 length:3549 start_codon:yes stop_codon:yes gene_type:complete